MSADLIGSVLVVEDDPQDAEVLLRGLRRIPDSSLDVRLVTTLRDARRAVLDAEPQIVLTDLTLPDARGLEVVEALTAVTNCSVIVQTGLDDAAMPIEALELGAQDFLQKGTITTDVLGRAIRYALARTRTQAELHSALRDRDESVSELDGFAHVVAHDLRAPVRTARLFAERLLHQIETDDPVALDYGARLGASLEKVDRMILSMLEFAALREGLADQVPVDISECVSLCTSLVKADLDEAEGALNLKLEPLLFVQADDEQMTRVMVNLLANAVKYRREDVPLQIDVLSRSDGGDVVVDIIDNGTGVLESQAERAFEILERLDPLRSTGLGFGLPICRRIVESAGGSIGFVHDTDVGAHIQFRLPLAGR